MIATCPRCGEQAVKKEIHRIGVVQCTGCGSVVTDHGGKTAIEKWSQMAFCGSDESCAHCGGEGRYSTLNLTGGEYATTHLISCTECGNTVGASSKEAVEDKWAQRA